MCHLCTEAHTDYIRCLEVHPTQPYVLSSSDDLQIKLWDWEKTAADGAWTCTQVCVGQRLSRFPCPVTVPMHTPSLRSVPVHGGWVVGWVESGGGV